jgi:CheY-like chemotaxis protein
MDAAAPLAKIQQIQWELHQPQEPLDLEFDRDKLGKVVQNLLSNALKNTPPGGKVHLSIAEVAENNDHWSVSVEDTGIGISEAHLPFVFDRYYQVPGNQAPGGTGIGLSLVQLLVGQLKGNILVKSSPGKGSTFKVTLPKSYGRPTAMEVMEDASTQPPLILVAEDNPEILAYLCSCLPGYRTATAANGAAAYQLALELVPDVVLTDWMMPEMDGLQLCKALKEDLRTSHIPILLLTARNTVQDRLDGLRRGADVYLTKPFVEEELLLEVKRLIGLKDRFLHRYKQTSSSPLDGHSPLSLEDTVPEDAFMQHLEKVCLEHLSDSTFNVELMGRALALSHTQLHRKLVALTGKSPVHYLRHLRLLKAQELLTGTKLTVAEIAYQCGFEDPSYFTRIFTRELGKTPTQYRENC